MKQRTAVINGEHIAIEWNETGDKLEAMVNGRRYELSVRALSAASSWFGWDGRSVEAVVTPRDQGYEVSIGGHRILVEFLESTKRPTRHRGAADRGIIEVRAPMPGKVVKILRDSGEVKAREGIVIIEAMKMQNEIRSPKDGRIVDLGVVEGDAIGSGDLIARVE